MIQTSAIVFAVCASTLIDIVLTIGPIKTCRTNTLVAVNFITAVGLILTRITGAVIDIFFAVVALVTRRADALVVVYFVSASSSILTWTQ